MNPTILVLPIDDIAAGTVLAEALREPGGTVLLAAGAVLTDAALKALRRRGVSALGVLALDPADNDAARSAERERQCARLARLFRHSASGISSASATLLALLLHYRRGA